MSKFDKIFEAREREVPETNENSNKEQVAKKNTAKKQNTDKIKQKTSVETESSMPLNRQAKIKLGRPTAKRSNPDFVGLTTYVRRDTHTRAKIALLEEGQGKELSELVEDLIQSWLSKK